MLEYWGSMAGLSLETLMSTDITTGTTQLDVSDNGNVVPNAGDYSSDGSSTMVGTDGDEVEPSQTAPVERKLFSGKRKMEIGKRGKEKSRSHAESLLKGLEALELACSPSAPRYRRLCCSQSALEVQTAAIDRQSGQLERLSKF
ncbi:hypothetical protein DYB26_006510 [Aphanomyces astaci]|uniref:Uncharacterized protein n=1 Tax=Aphanomyces astaci TaxID=112090 RepID=A0A397FCK5_APHAT|nr:hypothetical protein DYB38_010224 [Aphanomyces astaci]RHY76792.1 hypothetical protein DYB34_008753 [Aphanomyces astaci]RHZ09930.1 hypothetical protein DYB26_006510 [Aphanomyces astaci]RHZ16744.1 hypothetical protein DYB31_008139 [Aphanomyces astaci]